MSQHRRIVARIKICLGVLVLAITVAAEIRMFYRLIVFWDALIFSGLSGGTGKAFLNFIVSAIVAQLLLITGCVLIGTALDKGSHKP